MKDGALLVNVARGPASSTPMPCSTRCTPAGCTPRSTSPTPSRCPRATRSGPRPNLLLSPHVGGDSTAMEPRAYALVREQLTRFAAGQELANVVTGDY